MQTVPIIGISRHRINNDGPGITTLVCLHGCSLNCRYCINPESKRKQGIRQTITTRELYNLLKRDTIYFLATGGGVCFGGGEPALYPEFIHSFREICNNRWKISIETSLNVPVQNIVRILHDIDCWIIDIKEMDPNVYIKYTGHSNEFVIENLKLLAKSVPHKVIIKVPLIPYYNTEDNQNKSICMLSEMGFGKIIRYNYSLA